MIGLAIAGLRNAAKRGLATELLLSATELLLSATELLATAKLLPTKLLSAAKRLAFKALLGIKRIQFAKAGLTWESWSKISERLIVKALLLGRGQLGRAAKAWRAAETGLLPKVLLLAIIIKGKLETAAAEIVFLWLGQREEVSREILIPIAVRARVLLIELVAAIKTRQGRHPTHAPERISGLAHSLRQAEGRHRSAQLVRQF